MSVPETHQVLRLAGRVGLALAIAFVGYFLVYRPQQLRWGATDEEIARAMPGDELQPHPVFDATRAVTIDASPERIWPWADGDRGPLGPVTTGEGFPIAGFFLAAVTAVLFILAALAAAGVWVPARWWRPLSVVGATLLVCLMGLFFGPTKLIPAGVALATLYVALARPALVAPD